MNWLKENIHSKASLYPFHQLVKEATGKDFSAESYIKSIKKRYLTEISATV